MLNPLQTMTLTAVLSSILLCLSSDPSRVFNVHLYGKIEKLPCPSFVHFCGCKFSVKSIQVKRFIIMLESKGNNQVLKIKNTRCYVNHITAACG